MTSYGAYSRTAYGNEAAGEGGGFVGGGSQTGSQGQSRNYSEDSLRPVTVKQLLQTEEAYAGASDVTIDGAVVTQLTLVGQVRAVNPQPTNVTYRIDDGTGVIDVKKWVDADKNEDADAKFELDQYVRVFGRLKLFNQKRFVTAHFLRAVEDYNEVSYHLLESTYVHLSFLQKQGKATNIGGAGAGGAAAGGDSMFVDQNGGGGGGGGGANKSNFSPSGQRIYDFMRNMATGNEGININVVANELKMSYGQAMDAMQELANSAVVYATMDDETFALLT